MDIPIEIAAGAVGAVITGFCWFLKYKITRLDKRLDDHTEAKINIKERVSKLEGVVVPREEYDKFTHETTKNITDLHWRFRSLRETLNMLGIDFLSEHRKRDMSGIDPQLPGDLKDE